MESRIDSSKLEAFASEIEPESIIIEVNYLNSRFLFMVLSNDTWLTFFGRLKSVFMNQSKEGFVDRNTEN